MSSKEKKWEGPAKLVLVLCIGTTYSEASFAYLTSGSSLLLYPVTRWPGQEARTSERRIPTAMWYDCDGKMTSAGAEAFSHQAEEDAEDNGWRLVNHFPWHLCPPQEKVEVALDPLPPRVSLSTVYRDFMSYLIYHTASFLQDRIIDGSRIWESYHREMTVLIVHPENYSRREQTFLRTTFKNINSNYAQCDVRLIGEGAAYAMSHPVDKPLDETQTNVLICNIAEWSTEIGTFQVEHNSSTTCAKLNTISHLDTGYKMIETSCKCYLSEVLADVGLDSQDAEEYASEGAKDFSLTAMRAFRSSDQEYTIVIAGSRFNNAAIRTRRGRMHLSGKIIEGFFEPHVSNIINGIRDGMAGVDIRYIRTVGVFGDNAYFSRKVLQEFGGTNCLVSNNSDFNSNNLVTWATTNHPPTLGCSFGILIGERHKPSNLEHHGRKVHHGHGGYSIVANRWSEVVKAGTTITTDSPVRRQLLRSIKPSRNVKKDLGKHTCDLWIFDGEESHDPIWVKDKAGQPNQGFQKICRVEAGIHEYDGVLAEKYKSTRQLEAVELFLVMAYNGEHLHAYLEWEEKGIFKKGPSVLIEY